VTRSLALAALAATSLLACSAAPRPPPAEQLAIRQRAAGETARRYDDPHTAAAVFGRGARTAAAGDRAALAADLKVREGLALLSAGDAPGALAALEQAAALARGAGDASLEARAWLGLARARQVAGVEGVAAALGEALAHARAGEDRTAEALAEVGLGALAPPAEARLRFAAAARLAGGAPEVAGPLLLNRARLDEREGALAAARAGYRAALAPLAAADDRPGLLAALSGAARLADADPAAATEAADLHRRAAAVAAGLGRREVAEREEAAARRSGTAASR